MKLKKTGRLEVGRLGEVGVGLGVNLTKEEREDGREGRREGEMARGRKKLQSLA